MYKVHSPKLNWCCLNDRNIKDVSRYQLMKHHLAVTTNSLYSTNQSSNNKGSLSISSGREGVSCLHLQEDGETQAKNDAVLFQNHNYTWSGGDLDTLMLCIIIIIICCIIWHTPRLVACSVCELSPRSELIKNRCYAHYHLYRLHPLVGKSYHRPIAVTQIWAHLRCQQSSATAKKTRW